MLILKNGLFLSAEGKFEKGDIAICDDTISSIGSLPGDGEASEIFDVEGCKVVPGLIDIHCHGAVGHDVMTSSPPQLKEIAEHLAKNGTTSFFPTTITSRMEDLLNVLRNVKEASKMAGCGSSIEGVHIEGPYINAAHKGCHDPSLIKQPTLEEYESFREIMGDLKIHMTVAPEMPGNMEFIKYAVSKGSTVGIGHSDGNCSDVKKGLEAGATIFTHLFNGMRGIHHREPGVAGTALASDAFVELICDGIHVHPEIIKMVYRVKGKEKIVLVTDAMQATGFGDGEFSFGGFRVFVKDGIARKEDGTLAGSTLTMFKAIKNMMKFTGIPLEDAVSMASLNPAKVVGLSHITGSIQPGKRADLVVIDGSMEIKMVFCRGKLVRADLM